MMFGDEAKARMLRTLARPERAIVSPPWERSREAVGFEFPEDYRWFFSEYGFGRINDYLQIRSASSKYVRILRAGGFAKLVAGLKNIDSCGGEGHSDPPYCDVNWNGRILTFAADSPDGLLLRWGRTTAETCTTGRAHRGPSAGSGRPG